MIIQREGGIAVFFELCKANGVERIERISEDCKDL